jgi:hypothetical protein
VRPNDLDAGSDDDVGVERSHAELVYICIHEAQGVAVQQVEQRPSLILQALVLSL